MTNTTKSSKMPDSNARKAAASDAARKGKPANVAEKKHSSGSGTDKPKK